MELVFPFLTGPESLFKVDDSLYAAAANAIYRVSVNDRHLETHPVFSISMVFKGKISGIFERSRHSEGGKTGLIFLFAILKVDLRSGNHTIVYDGNKNCSPERPCSRPLGIRIKGNRLLCADALQGLIEVDLSSGEFRQGKEEMDIETLTFLQVFVTISKLKLSPRIAPGEIVESRLNNLEITSR